MCHTTGSIMADIDIPVYLLRGVLFPVWSLLGVDSLKLSARIIDFRRTSVHRPNATDQTDGRMRSSYQRISLSEASSIFSFLSELSLARSLDVPITCMEFPGPRTYMGILFCNRVRRMGRVVSGTWACLPHSVSVFQMRAPKI